MTAVDPTHAIVVKVLRESRGLGLGPMDLATNIVDELHGADLISIGEIDDTVFDDVKARINKLWSSGSPCWECGGSRGYIAWVDGTNEYRHGVCPT